MDEYRLAEATGGPSFDRVGIGCFCNYYPLTINVRIDTGKQLIGSWGCVLGLCFG